MCEGEAAVCALDVAGGLQRCESFPEGGVAGAEGFAQGFALHGLGGDLESFEDALFEVRCCFDGPDLRIALGDAQMG